MRLTERRIKDRRADMMHAPGPYMPIKLRDGSCMIGRRWMRETVMFGPRPMRDRRKRTSPGEAKP